MQQSAIIVIDDYLSQGSLSVLITQLFINEVMTGIEFDNRLVVDPTYPDQIRMSGQKILIIRPLSDIFDRTIVDFVVTVRLGLLAVETSRFGPPGFTLPIDHIYLNRLFLNK